MEGSLRRLKLERIDLYQIHWPDPAVPFTESVGALVDMQQEGLIRLIGLSNVSLAQLEEARSLTDIATVQNRFNLYDQASREILKVCEQLDIGFIPYAPLVAGKLPQDPLEEVARVHQATPAQVALAWLLQRSPVVLPIPGTSRVTHLEENVAASTLVLSREELERLDL